MTTERNAQGVDGLAEVMGLIGDATPGTFVGHMRQDQSMFVSVGDPAKGPHAQGDVHMPYEDVAAMVAAVNYLRSHGEAIQELVDAAKDARYVGLHIGRDCALALADLQDAGIYRPRCSDGKPSNADARRDVAKIEESTAKLRAALAKFPEPRP